MHDHKEPLRSKRGSTQTRKPQGAAGTTAAIPRVGPTTTSYAAASYSGATPAASLTTLGTQIVHRQKPEIAWTVRQAALVADGSVEVTISADGQRPRRVGSQDLMQYWRLLDKGGVDTSAARIAAYEARAKKAWAARAAQLTQEAELARDAGIAAFCRAVRIVARRQAANLEASPLRQASEAHLASPRQLGVDATGVPVEYPGMDMNLARYIVAEIHQAARDQDLDYIFNRAADLMEKGDQYLLDAEADARHFSAALPPISAAAVMPTNPDMYQADNMRRAAIAGNFGVAPMPAPEGAPPQSFDKRSSIRNAVNGTLVSGALEQIRGLN